MSTGHFPNLVALPLPPAEGQRLRLVQVGLNSAGNRNLSPLWLCHRRVTLAYLRRRVTMIVAGFEPSQPRLPAPYSPWAGGSLTDRWLFKRQTWNPADSYCDPYLCGRGLDAAVADAGAESSSQSFSALERKSSDSVLHVAVLQMCKHQPAAPSAARTLLCRH